MVDHDPDSTVGIYCGPDAGMIEEFDAFFETRPGKYSRSSEIKNAMKLYLTVQETLEDLEFDIPERSQAHFVRQAIRAEARRDAER